jgi:hypothetical protein
VDWSSCRLEALEMVTGAFPVALLLSGGTTSFRCADKWCADKWCAGGWRAGGWRAGGWRAGGWHADPRSRLYPRPEATSGATRSPGGRDRPEARRRGTGHAAGEQEGRPERKTPQAGVTALEVPNGLTSSTRSDDVSPFPTRFVDWIRFSLLGLFQIFSIRSSALLPRGLPSVTKNVKAPHVQ